MSINSMYTYRQSRAVRAQEACTPGAGFKLFKGAPKKIAQNIRPNNNIQPNFFVSMTYAKYQVMRFEKMS